MLWHEAIKTSLYLTKCHCFKCQWVNTTQTCDADCVLQIKIKIDKIDSSRCPLVSSRLATVHSLRLGCQQSANSGRYSIQQLTSLTVTALHRTAKLDLTDSAWLSHQQTRSNSSQAQHSCRFQQSPALKHHFSVLPPLPIWRWDMDGDCDNIKEDRRTGQLVQAQSRTDSQCPLVRIRHQWWDTLSYGAATPVRHCSQLSSVLLWPSAPHRPLTRPFPCSTCLHFGSSWWLETEDSGGWPATNEPRTGDVEAACSEAWRKLVTTATSTTSKIKPSCWTPCSDFSRQRQSLSALHALFSALLLSPTNNSTIRPAILSGTRR